MQGLMAEGTDRYTATRLSAELGLDNRKMRDILTRVNPVQVKGRSKLYLLRDVIPHAAKYLGAPDVIDLNAERARKVKAEAELAEIELAKERGPDRSRCRAACLGRTGHSREVATVIHTSQAGPGGCRRGRSGHL